MRLAMIMVLVASGWVSRYDPGLMQEPIYNRTHGFATPAIRQDWQGFDGYAAARYPEEIDKEYIVCPLDQELPCLHVLVVDCAGVKDGALEWMINGHIWLEMDYNSMVQIWKKPKGGLRVNIFEYKRVEERRTEFVPY